MTDVELKSPGSRQLAFAHNGFAALVVVITASVLLGWLLHVQTLKTVLPGLTTMKANAALGLMAAGVSAGLAGRRSGRARAAATVAAAAAGLIGLSTMIEYATGIRLGIDELLFRDPDTTSRPFPGRMSPVTAVALGASGLGLALLALVRSPRAAAVAHALAAIPGFAGLLALAGYAYGVERLYNFGPFVAVALNAAAVLLFLSMAILTTRIGEGWARPFLRRPIAMRALLQVGAISILAPFATGLLIVWGTRRGWYDAAFSPALFAVAASGALIWLAFRSASILGRAEDEINAARAERTQLDVARRQSDEQFRVFAETVPNHIWAGGPDGDLDWFNTQVYDYAGEQRGTLDGVESWTRIVHPEDLPAAGAAWMHSLSTGEPYETEFRIRRGDGVYQWFLVRASPVRGADGAVVRWVGTNTDIDNAKRQAGELARLNEHLEAEVASRTGQLMEAEEQLRQAQKMEAVGQLTGGIAHDFNNLLAGITGSLELIRSRIAQGRLDAIDRYMLAAEGAARRAAALTQRLLAFSRRQTLNPKPLDVNRLVAGMEDIVRRTVGPSIALEVVGAGGLWMTLIDASQLDNALLNLCINARDAMPDGGRLTIETANKWLDERAAPERDLPPGQYVTLCVTDTGTGMTPEVIARAFDPFFTTKPLGAGTGLGLSMIYGFVRQSGGQVRVYSELGQGTTLCLYLPRYTGPDAKDGSETMAGAPSPLATLGETVLVVDDEPTVRMLVAEILNDAGYLALEAADGAAAMKIVRSEVRLDLLITDVGLPGGMNGRQVADAARAHRPGLKALFITGYAENAAVGNGHLERGMDVVTKPFSMEQLATKIRQMIEGG